MVLRKPAAYRSKIKIYVDMLEVIRREGGEAKPTKILYGANLSYDRFQKYISQLKEKEFIVEVKKNDGKILSYKLTDKAYNFLEEFKKVKRFIDAFGLTF
ncbi:hypothetical protein DRO51_03640 [Candidatus Bathyarchaeota archaeon]|nr:MAG: hypothetical protein DRO51_03640 [Candidatus Bathyarchaeota archaeon]